MNEKLTFKYTGTIFVQLKFLKNVIYGGQV